MSVSYQQIPARGLKRGRRISRVAKISVSYQQIPARGLKQFKGRESSKRDLSFLSTNPRKGTET